LAVIARHALNKVKELTRLASWTGVAIPPGGISSPDESGSQ